MKLRDKLNAAVTAARIECHWWFILLYRKRGCRMLQKDVPLGSCRLLRLSRRIDRHGLAAVKLEDRYKNRWVAEPSRMATATDKLSTPLSV